MNLLADIDSSTLRYWLATAAVGAKALNLPSDAAKLAYLRGFDQARARWEAYAIKRVKAQFRAEMRALLNNLEHGWSNLDAVAWDKVLSDIHNRTARDFAERTYDELEPRKVTAAAVLAKPSLLWRNDDGSPLHTKDLTDLWMAAIREWIGERMGALVTGILATTREALRKTLGEGIAQGEGVYELTKRVKRLYLDEIIPHRAEVIARTEVIAASNFGSRAAAKATGLTLTKEWLATKDNRTRDSHRAANGQKRPLDEPYTVGGARLMFPGDTSLGAPGSETIQCRCAEVYAVVR
jgi:SPP1 gp7 family putative phage head morphogenesis protein